MATNTTIINSFNGGISNDRRVNQANKFALTKHFDAFSYKHKLVPHRKTTSFGDAQEEAKSVTKFTVAKQGANTAVWGIGKGVVDDTKIAVYYASGDGLTGGWTAPSNNESTIDYVGASGLESPKIIFPYKDKLYTFADDRLIVFTIGGTWDNTGTDLSSITTVAEPVHHPNDDIAYFFYDNVVGKIDGASAFEDNVLVLPTNLKITSACAYGNYLAIACVTKDSIDQSSVVYLWDRDSSLTTLSQIIDFGKGKIEKLSNLNNNLIALMTYHLGDTYTAEGGEILIKQANGDFAVTLNRLLSDDAFTGNVSNGITENNILYIAFSSKRDNDERYGIWAIESNGEVTLDFIEEDVETIAEGAYNGIFKTGNVWWIANSSDGSVGRTHTGASPYFSTTLTSVYESLIFDDGDLAKTKKLIGVTVETEALPSNGNVVLKYRKDEDLNGGSWTTILTHSGEDEVRSSAINISGATLPQYKEIQFRLESLNGAVITGLKWKSEYIEDDIY